MSRSAKERVLTRYAWGRGLEDPTDEKAGNRRHVGGRANAVIGGAIFKRHWHGSTEKIRRRNRRVFERLAGKLRRSADRDEIARQLHAST